MAKVLVFSVGLWACGAPEPTGLHDATGPHDAASGQSPKDAPLAEPDAPPPEAACATFAKTTVAADGRRTEEVYRRAPVPGVKPEDHVVVMTCYQPGSDPFVPSCAPGATCTGSIVPSGTHCLISDGEWFGGTLYIMCSGTVTQYDAAGNVTSMVSATYDQRVIRR